MLLIAPRRIDLRVSDSVTECNKLRILLIMGHHAISLFRRSWNLFIGSLGITTLGFFAPFAVPVAGLIVYVVVALRREGWQGLREHLRKTLTIATFVAIVAELTIYAPIFAWTLVKTIYEDHMSLVAVALRQTPPGQLSPNQARLGY